MEFNREECYKDLKYWSDAHIMYDLYLDKPNNKNDIVAWEEYKYRKKIINESPNAHLIKKNAFFDTIKAQDKIYLAHSTPNIHNIKYQNTLYPSAGCMVGTIYSTPITKDDYGLRLHNLGEYIFYKESKKTLNKEKQKHIELLIIEVDLSNAPIQKPIGVDYTRLGHIHFQNYLNLEFLLSVNERYQLETKIINRIQASAAFLNLCTKRYFYNYRAKDNDFIPILLETIDNLPELGYYYFEIISEYIMLYEDNKESKKYHQLGELYNYSYKDLVFNLFPKLPKNFSLRLFQPKLKDLTNYIKDNNIIKKFDENHLKKHIINRMTHMVISRLLEPEFKIDIKKFIWKFDILAKYMPKLIGNLIHRELRSYGRYPNFYFYFDQLKALSIWNYWNHMNILVPFNGFIPKGEVGINPAYPDLNYKIYLGEVYKHQGYSYVNLKNELRLNISPKLVDLKFTIMGLKDHLLAKKST